MNKYIEMKQEILNGMNTSRAARYCGVLEALLRKFRQNGDGPLYCKVEKKVVYRKDHLDQFLETCLVK